MTSSQPDRYDANAVRDSGRGVREFASELSEARDAERRAEADSWHPTRVRDLYFGRAPSARPYCPASWNSDTGARRGRSTHKVVGIIFLLGLIATFALLV